MKVLSYIYIPNQKKKVFAEGNGYDYYVRHGYTIVGDYRDEGFCILNKPAEVIFEVIDDDGNYGEVDCKDTILRVYKKKRISKQMAKRFYDEVQAGKWRLAFDKGGNLIAFPRS